MTRAELVKQVQRYFALRELVDETTYRKYGDYAWNFFDSALLETLLVLRENILKVPMTINDWMRGGKFSQRGLRSNLCQLVVDKTYTGKLYMSAHCLGKGVDFDAKGMTAAQVRKAIQDNANKLPYPIRLEDGVNWVHCDVMQDGSKGQVILFKV